MAKFTNEQKMVAVIRYQSKSESVREFAHSLGDKQEVVPMWTKQAEYHGLADFKSPILATPCCLRWTYLII